MNNDQGIAGDIAAPGTNGSRDWLTVAEAALELRVSEKSVRKLLKRKVFKILPNIRPYRITRRSVNAAKEGRFYE